jgi:thiosulfate/3-mercaptopyruvate sulfurtransferase
VIPPIVDSAFLVEHHKAVVLIDVRWYLDGRDGFAAFRERHLPGAQWIDLDTELSANGLPATEGRHPLPAPDVFAAAMTAHGIGDNSVVVAYDDTGGIIAGRLVVMLRMLGHDAALLDGGLLNWAGEIEAGPGPDPRHDVTFTVKPWPANRLATADETAAAAAVGVPVLDARAHARFTGELSLVDKRPGHIPGARSAPGSDVLDAAGLVREPDELREHYFRRGIDDDTTNVIAYCGSGVSACINILAVEHAGFAPPRLYVASWSGWSADPHREAVVGE